MCCCVLGFYLNWCISQRKWLEKKRVIYLIECAQSRSSQCIFGGCVYYLYTFSVVIVSFADKCISLLLGLFGFLVYLPIWVTYMHTLVTIITCASLWQQQLDPRKNERFVALRIDKRCVSASLSIKQLNKIGIPMSIKPFRIILYNLSGIWLFG